jgi:hypothetical protein
MFSSPAEGEEAEPVLIVLPAAARRRRGRHPSLTSLCFSHLCIYSST